MNSLFLGFPDPNVLPSVASIALQSEMPEECKQKLFMYFYVL